VNDNTMATTINKQRLLNLLLHTAERGGSGDPEPLPVLQQFVYGLCRENATAEQADRAYHNLTTKFFDWNEVRVSSPRELEDALAGLSEPEVRAQRLLAFLQEVFETTFSFDLDKLQKAGVKQAAKQLARYQAADDYIGAWVLQRSLGGHAIPIDAPTLRCARRLGLIEPGQEGPEAVRASLEHLVGKSKGAQFTDAISDLAEEHCWETEPNCHACPMNGECPTAQEMGTANGVATRTRTKPR
jgi:endonuclease III